VGVCAVGLFTAKNSPSCAGGRLTTVAVAVKIAWILWCYDMVPVETAKPEEMVLVAGLFSLAATF
jgi:hypothetical protein